MSIIGVGNTNSMMDNNNMPSLAQMHQVMKRRNFTTAQSRAPEQVGYLQKRAPMSRQPLARAINDLSSFPNRRMLNDSYQNENSLSSNLFNQQQQIIAYF